MNLERWNDGIKRFCTLLGAVCASLALVLVVATSTDLIALPHTSEVIADRTEADTVYASDRRIDSATVAKTTRGKAVFRTLRVLSATPIDDSGRFRLVGTSERNGAKRAYVKDTKMKKTLTLYVGDSLGGRYEVMSITKDSVELKRGNEITALRK